MTVTSIEGHWFTAYAGTASTVQVNIAPDFVYATAVLQGADGDGLNFAGISHYRRRLDNGQDQDVDFGVWLGWPPTVYDRMSSITFAAAIGAHQEAWVYGRMDHWA